MAKGVEVKVGVVLLSGVLHESNSCHKCDFQDYGRDRCLLFDRKIVFIASEGVYVRCKACRDAEVKP